MDEVSVAALPATIPEPGSFEISYQLSYFPRHDASLQANSSEVDAQPTQAQRPGPRDAWIATRARWPGSLQRMVRPHSRRPAHKHGSDKCREETPGLNL